MKTKPVAGAVVVIIVVIALAFIALNSMSVPPSATSTTTASGSSQGGQSAQLFASSRYYQNAYLISGNATLSAPGRAATSDFNLTSKALTNGSAEYTLVFVDTKATYNVTIAPGEGLYYIDTNLVDDSSSSDSFHLDDGYAVANATGYIVSQLHPLPRT